MAYVRWLISEERQVDWVVRRYEVETPHWYPEWLLEVQFPKLVELELRISHDCAHYFRKVPYSLAETIWVRGLKSWCCRPFCCSWDFEVLYYPVLPQPRMLTTLSRPYHDRSIVLELGLNPPDHPSILLNMVPPVEMDPG